MKSRWCILLVALMLAAAMSLSACIGSVVPAAWVSLDMEGYVVYTSNMYPSGGDHVYLYDSEEEASADKHHAAYSMAIVFFPRILGADTVDGVRTTIVDVGERYCTMTVYINKNKSLYQADKRVYIGDTALTPAQTNDLDVLLCLTYEHVPLVRGNPGGRENGVINYIRYR